MALDNFYFKVKKLDVLPDEYAAKNTERYENNTKIVYGIHAKAYAEKGGFNTEQEISVPLAFNGESSFINWENLTETNVISWIESFVNVEELKASMEIIIDQRISLNTQTNLPWSN